MVLKSVKNETLSQAPVYENQSVQYTASTAIASKRFGVSTTVIVAVLSACILLLLTGFILYTWRYVNRQKKKKKELNAITPQVVAPQTLAGIRADQPIEFVVPTITMSGSTPFSLTEDSMSDSDYLGLHSGSEREGFSRTRQRHPAGRYHISPHEISKGLYPECDSNVQVKAQVNFVFHYSFHRQQLLVTLLSAKNLPVNEKRAKVNPFAKVLLLPEKTPKFLTKVHKNNSNPSFNELFIFPTPRHSLDNRVLKISVWDYDRFSRKNFIGRCFYPLSNAGITSLVTNDVITDEIWVNLSERKDLLKTGEILISLCYRPESSTLTLGIVKVKNLCIKDVSSDLFFFQVYAKVMLYLRKKKIRTRKTQARKAQHEIEFNDVFQVHVLKSALSDVEISITVCGRSTTSLSKHVFGKTLVGETCSVSQGVQHWFDMVHGMSSTVVQCHHLL
ncbi:Synaptotagmin-9-like protein [Dinothrombium tinctorium]|uniref:Synaptotagmin-9-like protein n=1 Tax=Dinothrombium tinctorium TaxID=1965070 RepID=A0A3S3PGE3_9ACAR|nr:Synaptotagmin-9-like protein [Dinothrombium tinctorium]RWS14722.1 Synaptotagmin-9-like protein [Dinothrombium tinctorium]